MNPRSIELRDERLVHELADEIERGLLSRDGALRLLDHVDDIMSTTPRVWLTAMIQVCEERAQRAAFAYRDPEAMRAWRELAKLFEQARAGPGRWV